MSAGEEGRPGNLRLDSQDKGKVLQFSPSPSPFISPFITICFSGEMLEHQL